MKPKAKLTDRAQSSAIWTLIELIESVQNFFFRHQEYAISLAIILASLLYGSLASFYEHRLHLLAASLALASGIIVGLTMSDRFDSLAIQLTCILPFVLMLIQLEWLRRDFNHPPTDQFAS